MDVAAHLALPFLRHDLISSPIGAWSPTEIGFRTGRLPAPLYSKCAKRILELRDERNARYRFVAARFGTRYISLADDAD
jgi:hypothetical protein